MKEKVMVFLLYGPLNFGIPGATGGSPQDQPSLHEDT